MTVFHSWSVEVYVKQEKTALINPVLWRCKFNCSISFSVLRVCEWSSDFICRSRVFNHILEEIWVFGKYGSTREKWIILPGWFHNLLWMFCFCLESCNQIANSLKQSKALQFRVQKWCRLKSTTEIHWKFIGNKCNRNKKCSNTMVVLQATSKSRRTAAAIWQDAKHKHFTVTFRDLIRFWAKLKINCNRVIWIFIDYIIN